VKEYEPPRELKEGENWWEDPERVGGCAATLVVLGVVCCVLIVLILVVIKGVTSLLW
jgi:hypothetical protein